MKRPILSLLVLLTVSCLTYVVNAGPGGPPNAHPNKSATKNVTSQAPSRIVLTGSNTELSFTLTSGAHAGDHVTGWLYHYTVMDQRSGSHPVKTGDYTINEKLDFAFSVSGNYSTSDGTLHNILDLDPADSAAGVTGALNDACQVNANGEFTDIIGAVIQNVIDDRMSLLPAVDIYLYIRNGQLPLQPTIIRIQPCLKKIRRSNTLSPIPVEAR